MTRGAPLIALLCLSCGGRALPGAQDAGTPGTGEAWRAPEAGPALDLAAVSPGPDRSFGPDPWGHCAPGQRMWCDSLVYDGWGLVECDPQTGRWKTRVANGTTVLDCHESTNGERPNTVCACYHFFTNFGCCERPDCVLQPGEGGQVCPPSPGQLCDYCNPLDAECVEPGATCIVTNAHETFCGRDCAAAPCPTGYGCLTIKLKVGTTRSFVGPVPVGFSDDQFFLVV